MKNGWVKLHRKILEDVDLMNDDTACLVFVKLLLLANSNGEIAESGRSLSRLVSTEYNTLYKVLKRLEKYEIIKQFSKHSYTLICICKWSDYQSVGKHFGKHTVSTRQAHGKQLTEVARIENKNKNRINKKDGKGYELAKAKYELIKQKAL